jgi:hypothetical protein
MFYSKAFYLIFESYASTQLSTHSNEIIENNLTNFSSLAISTSELSNEENDEEIFNTPFQSIVDAFIITLGDLQQIYEKLVKVPHHTILGQVLFF